MGVVPPHDTHPAAIEALLPAEPDTAAQARALHARREQHQALDYGFALLGALDLSPCGLDIIDGAIAHLDAKDAPDEDMEPYLAGYCGRCRGGEGDRPAP